MFNQNEEETQGSELGTLANGPKRKEKKRKKKKDERKGKDCGRASARPMLNHGPPTPYKYVIIRIDHDSAVRKAPQGFLPAHTPHFSPIRA
jgi:hypothetical protein